MDGNREGERGGGGGGEGGDCTHCAFAKSGISSSGTPLDLRMLYCLTSVDFLFDS